MNSKEQKSLVGEAGPYADPTWSGRYRDLEVPHAFMLDPVIDGLMVVELKVAEVITKEHEAQVLSYLRFSEKPVGLFMNFALQPLVKPGIRRFPLTPLPSSASSV
jgi:GxxExxY protein